MGVSRVKKHLVSVLIALGIIAVFYASFANGGNRHGDRETWVNERHAVQVRSRQADADDFCLKCHAKMRNESKQQTLNGFCNKCHSASGRAKVDIKISEE